MKVKFTFGLSKMKFYASNQDLLKEMLSLLRKLKRMVSPQPRTSFVFGLSCLNGLTDGWALLMDSVAKTIPANGRRLNQSQLSDPRTILEVIKKVVYR